MIANYRQALPIESEPIVKVDPNTLLLLHGEELIDSSSYQRELQNSGAVISTDQSKFGESSLYFNGSSKLLIPEMIDFGSGDFTIDWWEWCTGSGARFSSAWTSNSQGWGGLLLGYQGTSVYASSNLDGSGIWNLINGAQMISVSTSTWIHWAFVRKGNQLISYRNGSQYATSALNGVIYHDTTTPMAVGGYREGDQSLFKGYIDEFRISNIARWDGPFTPPTEPYER